jgi:hypothetical protein
MDYLTRDKAISGVYAEIRHYRIQDCVGIVNPEKLLFNTLHRHGAISNFLRFVVPFCDYGVTAENPVFSPNHPKKLLVHSYGPITIQPQTVPLPQFERHRLGASDQMVDYSVFLFNVQPSYGLGVWVNFN